MVSGLMPLGRAARGRGVCVGVRDGGSRGDGSGREIREKERELKGTFLFQEGESLGLEFRRMIG